MRDSACRSLIVKKVEISLLKHSETNTPPPMINVVCMYLRQFIGASFGVATLPIYYNIE